MKHWFTRILIFVLAGFPLKALADAFEIPAGDPGVLLLKLATDWKALGVVGVISVITMLSSIAVNAWVPATWKFKRLVTYIIAMVYSAVAAVVVAPGGSVLASVTGVLLTGLIAKGGASEIYEILKGAGVIKKAAA